MSFNSKLSTYITCADGTVHNLNEYMDIQRSEALKTIEADSVAAVFTEKLGVVVGQNQLAEFFSQIS